MVPRAGHLRRAVAALLAPLVLSPLFLGLLPGCQATHVPPPQVVGVEPLQDKVVIRSVPEADVYTVDGRRLGKVPYEATVYWELHRFDDGSSAYLDIAKGDYVRTGSKRHLQYLFVMPGGQRVIQSVSWTFTGRPQKLERTVFLTGLDKDKDDGDTGPGVSFPPDADVPTPTGPDPDGR